MGGRYLHRSICQRRTSLIRRQPQPLPPSDNMNLFLLMIVPVHLINFIPHSILREGFIFAKSVVLPSFLVIFTSRCLYIDRIDNSKVEYNDNLESTLIGGGLAP
uniref:Uncharacterized protein n=1 Tax=Oryza barthii TaxID=65489 RepID=A0A0D3FTL6_9ORYZ